MAFSYGFFNSKGLDRTYTAENFCDYLGSIICNGIQDTYGQKFSLRPATGLNVTLGTGKAWLDGHYFISDAPYNIDLTSYQDESLPRWVAISIVLDVSESARKAYIEVTPGTPAESPALPVFPQSATKTRLLMYCVRINPGYTSLSLNDWYDYRDDDTKCGYCRCILGKCEVSDMQFQLKHIFHELQIYNEQVSELQERLTEIEEVTGVTGVLLVSSGQIGESAYYALFSNGHLKIYGTGETYSYDIVNEGTESPFRGSEAITSITVVDGITKVGDQIFSRVPNLTSITLPNSVTEIGWGSFLQADGYIGVTYGPENIIFPNHLTKIGKAAFNSNNFTNITIPATVDEIGDSCFDDCARLEEATVLGSVIGNHMFTHCSSLTRLTVTTRLNKIGTYAFNYCRNLTTIVYNGTISQWQAIQKVSDWSCKVAMDVAKSG